MRALTLCARTRADASPRAQVWEVMAADLSISPVHMGAVGKAAADKGIALRFPWVARARRGALPPHSCTRGENPRARFFERPR